MKTTRIGSRLVAYASMIVAIAGCSKAPASSSNEPAASASAATSGAPSGSASSAKPEVQAPTTWAGTYEAVAGTLYVPDGGEWSGVKFRGEDASVGLGAGTLSVTVDPSGRAEGTGEGALGALTVSGLVEGDTFSARLAPTDPNAGFTGVAMGKRDGAGFKGTMHLSYTTANVIREASFTLAKK